MRIPKQMRMRPVGHAQMSRGKCSLQLAGQVMSLETICPWPWSKRQKAQGPRSVNIFFGFFFVVNFCLGTGFLSIPYSFFYAGYLAAIPTLLLISFVSWNTATWTVEVMARAQAVESFTKAQPPEDAGSNSEEEKDSINKSLVSVRGYPNFKIVLTRKFEPSELCEIFFNKWGKYIYLVIMTIYCFLAAWSFSTVAGTAWASNIPFNFGSLNQCNATAFQHKILPSGSCLHAYYFSLFLFGAIVIPLSILGLKEQAIIQMILGLLRFATVAMILIYSIVKLIQEGTITCAPQNTTSFWDNQSNMTINDTNLTASTRFELHDIVLKFDPKGWLTTIPVFTYAFIIHQGIPSLTHPIKQKQYLRWFMVCMFGIAGFCYLSLGIITPLWFRAQVQEIVTLNWGRLTKEGNPPQLRALSYYLIFFPSLDVCSAYPLIVHAITNNIYTVFMGQDTSKSPKYRFDWLVRLLLRFFAAVLPITAAFGISNLVYVLKYAGLFGFGICFIFPTALQLQSIRVCKKKFQHVYVTQKLDVPDSVHRESSASRGNTETTPLLSLQDVPDPSSSYLTPYSSRFLSHPIAVTVIGTVALFLFVLAIASLFVSPDKIYCLPV